MAIKRNNILYLASKRKSCRLFSEKAVDVEDVLYAIRVACEAPSGANSQPWRFMLITDKDVKKEVREVCERSEMKFYSNIKGELKTWLEKKGLNWSKPFLTQAPILLAVFTEVGKPYAIQSTWLAIGYLLLALEERGLGSLTYTPPEPSAIEEILNVPDTFKLQTIIPIGYSMDPKPKEPRRNFMELLRFNRWNSSQKIGVERE
ncbi:MAG: nitroreductase family protein [Thermoprotei archaeon]|nr:MAG: nitroreductase family protein [Thermoprotei archaeon]